MNLENSNYLYERSQRVLAGGAGTLSKNPDRFAQGVTPMFLEGGRGGRVWDVDGNEYIDTVAALGPMILGYQHPDIDDAVTEQVLQGASFSLMHPLEVEVAERLVDLIPCAEQVRFGKNGGDATAMAVRVARHHTGRQHVICCGYHGFHDWYIASTDKAGGILPEVMKYTHQVQWGDVQGLRKLMADLDGEVAAIIAEVPPAPIDGRDDTRVFLELLRTVTTKYKAVFILDEVVTGFRYALGGAQEIYQVTPDLATFGKGLANGYPLSALVGKAEIMRHFANGEVFFSTTYGGEAVSLAAAKATLGALEGGALETLVRNGRALRQGLHEAAKASGAPVEILGNHARLIIKFRDTEHYRANELKTLFFQETIRRGVLFGGPVFPMAMHTDADVKQVISVAAAAFERVAMAVECLLVLDMLDCPPIEDVFGARYPGGAGHSGWGFAVNPRAA